MEIEQMRKEWKEQEGNWKKKREEMRECIKGLKKRVEELKGGGGKESEGADLKRGMRGGGKIAENRLLKIERKVEMREREERRRNIIIKRVEVKDGKKREAVEKVLKVVELEQI